MDQIFLELCCKECSKPIVDSGVRPVLEVDYGTPEELVESVARVVRSVNPPPVTCAACGGKPKIVHYDYHAFSSMLGCDLVVRSITKGGLLSGAKSEFLRWSLATGYLPLDPLPQEVVRRFGRDAAIRKAWTQIEVGGTRQALPTIEKLIMELGGDKELLVFVPPLLAVGKASVAARIAQLHADAWPNDPQGHYWLAEILIQAIAHGVVSASRLDEAARLLDRALAADSSYGPALVAKAHLPRLQGDVEVAYRALSELATSRPDLGDAHFYLGLMTLEKTPAKALEHFERAEKTNPYEPDYVLGRARALARLGRMQEAREAVARVKGLAPNHPKLPEVERLLV